MPSVLLSAETIGAVITVVASGGGVFAYRQTRAAARVADATTRELEAKHDSIVVDTARQVVGTLREELARLTVELEECRAERAACRVDRRGLRLQIERCEREIERCDREIAELRRQLELGT